MATERRKVEFEIVLKKHAIMVGETDADFEKEVQKLVDYNYYQNSDTCEARITKMVKIE